MNNNNNGRRQRQQQPQFQQPQQVFTKRKQNKPKKEKKQKQSSWWDTLAGVAGTFAGKAGMAMLSGFGDYTVQTNNLLAEATSGGNGSEVPMMVNSKTCDIIRHREYIGDVYGSTSAFSKTTYSINPGLKETFPWLYPIAGCFTAYRMRGLVFEFKSLATEYSALPYIGYVAMGTQYNSLDTPFTDKKSLENCEYSNSCKSSESMMHPIECAPNQVVLSELYTRTSATTPSKSDQRLYDMGEFTIATGGQASVGIIGELWATYEVEFYQSKAQSIGGALALADFFSSDNTCGVGAPMGVNPLVIDPRNTLGGTTTIATGTYTFPATITSGVYIVEHSWSGTNAVINFQAYSFVNCAAITAAFYNNQLTQSPADGATSGLFVARMIVKISGISASFSLNLGSVIPTTSYYDLSVVQMPPAIALKMNNKQQIQDESEEDEEEIIPQTNGMNAILHKYDVTKERYLDLLNRFGYDFVKVEEELIRFYSKK